jgi:hypothetical protein
MKRLYGPILALLIMCVSCYAQTAPDSAELTKLLKDFLAGASRNDAAMHDRFWAEDLIYTRSAGRRIGKADVMRDVRSAPQPKPGDPKTTYTAEDIRIQQYGSTAIVAFRLVGEIEKDGTTDITNYLNTGTFLKRNGTWQAVSWQSTRIPRPDADTLKQVAAIEAAFHQATLAADVKKLESLLDESFIWTHRTGGQLTRQQLLNDLGSGRLKYAKLENRNVTIVAYGDAAVVRGISQRQHSAIPGGGSDAAPFDAVYTLMFVNRGGVWKAVAMHSSRPE